MWVDAEEDGVKAAEAAGVKAILLDDLDDALRKLADLTGVQVQTRTTNHTSTLCLIVLTFLGFHTEGHPARLTGSC